MYSTVVVLYNNKQLYTIRKKRSKSLNYTKQYMYKLTFNYKNKAA